MIGPMDAEPIGMVNGPVLPPRGYDDREHLAADVAAVRDLAYLLWASYQPYPVGGPDRPDHGAALKALYALWRWADTIEAEVAVLLAEHEEANDGCCSR